MTKAELTHPESREGLVERLRGEILAGIYRADPAAIASAILGRAQREGRAFLPQPFKLCRSRR